MRAWLCGSERWAALADDFVYGLGQFLETSPESSVPAGEVAAHARAAREEFLAPVLEPAGDAATAEPG